MKYIVKDALGKITRTYSPLIMRSRWLGRSTSMRVRITLSTTVGCGLRWLRLQRRDEAHRRCALMLRY